MRDTLINNKNCINTAYISSKFLFPVDRHMLSLFKGDNKLEKINKKLCTVLLRIKAVLKSLVCFGYIDNGNRIFFFPIS